MAGEHADGLGSRTRGPGRGRPGVDAAARSYLVELAQRYVPFFLVIGILLFLVIEAPTVAGGSGGGGADSNAFASSPYAKSATGTGTGTGKAGRSPGTTGTTGAGPGTEGGTAATPAAGSSTAGGSTQSDVATSGVTCGPGVLQVPWSPYAPPCVPAFHGDNGGATAQGVSGSTITISYREEGESTDVNAVRSILPGVLPTDSQALYDLNVFLQIFNKTFELYGRHVVLKPYSAQGDALQELVGQDTQGAQEDAATAAGFSAFGDITPLPTPLYAQALVQNHVVSFDSLLASSQFLSSSAPYAYSLVPALDTLGKLLVSVGCKIGTTPVSYAGNTGLNGKPRTFGVIVPEDPQFQGLESTVLAGLRGCGISVPAVINYSINLSTVQQQMQNAISQMKAANVTTVICGCDPVGLIYATEAADQQNYQPEWVSEWLPDQFERLFSQDQWSHSLEFGLGPALPKQQVEGYQVFKLADPNGEPAEPLYQYIYYELFYLFEGLQAAGPDLTPASLLAGYQHLPDTAVGQAGSWTHGPGIYWPFSEAQVSYWSPAKVSAYDGKPGDFASCFGGNWFSMFDTTNFPTALDCPGQPS